MSTPTTAAGKGDALDRITGDRLEAERIRGLSYQTLERHHKAGELVGRVKIGRRVLFVRKQLESWITSKLTVTTNSPARGTPRADPPPHHRQGPARTVPRVHTHGRHP